MERRLTCWRCSKVVCSRCTKSSRLPVCGLNRNTPFICGPSSRRWSLGRRSISWRPSWRVHSELYAVIARLVLLHSLMHRLRPTIGRFRSHERRKVHFCEILDYFISNGPHAPSRATDSAEYEHSENIRAKVRQGRGHLSPTAAKNSLEDLVVVRTFRTNLSVERMRFFLPSCFSIQFHVVACPCLVPQTYFRQKYAQGGLLSKDIMRRGGGINALLKNKEQAVCMIFGR